MDKDPETLEEAIEQIKRWRELYCAKLQEISEMNEELYRVRAEARAEALKEAADRAVTWYRQGQLIPAHKDSFAIKQLRAAILADEPKVNHD